VPYPIDPDTSKAYCLVWVPPTYRDVPTVVKCREGCVEYKPVWRKDVRFEEVCRPGPVVRVCEPDSCRDVQVVQTQPPHLEWQPTCCPGPDSECCYRPVPVPGTQIVCDKTVTDEGIRYCYRKPPEYEVVAHEVRTCVPMAEYRPADYGVVWQKELFQPGRWEWQERSGCACPPKGCPPPAVCAPAPCAPPPAAPACGPCGGMPRKGDFSYAPPQN
jgi:hypothetical protein